MVLRISPIAVVLLAWAATASAGLNRAVMVPAYEACTRSNCYPPTRSSAYTFDSIYLYSSAKQYTGANKLALMVVVKGLRDPAGNLFTGRLTMPTPKSRITITSSSTPIGTFADDSPLTAQPPYAIDVKNGDARARFYLPKDSPSGLVANALEAPVVYDPEGKPLATTGTQTR